MGALRMASRSGAGRRPRLCGRGRGAADRLSRSGDHQDRQPRPGDVGSTLTYTIQVQNLGPDAATGVTVTDQLPKGVDFVSATATSGQCAHKGKKVTCDLGRLGAPTIDYGGPPTVTHLRHPSPGRDDQQHRLGEGRPERPGRGQQQGHRDDHRHRPGGDLPRRPRHDHRHGGRRHHRRHRRP